VTIQCFLDLIISLRNSGVLIHKLTEPFQSLVVNRFGKEPDYQAIAEDSEDLVAW
jgi:hypothetical protein